MKNHNEKGIVGQVAGTAAGLWLLALLLGFMLSRRGGVFVILTLLYGFGVSLVAGAAIYVLTGGSTVAEGTWFMAICFAVGAVIALGQLPAKEAPPAPEPDED